MIIYPDEPPTIDELLHFGVKGMKWGVRKDQEGNFRSETSGIQIEPGFHPSTRQAAVEVSNLIRERYGYNIKSIKVLGPDKPEYPNTAAYVENNKKNNGRNEGTIFVQTRDLSKPLSDAEKVGWFAPGTGNTRSLLTHESAHSIFHADQKVKAGLLAPKVVGGDRKKRDVAIKVAIKAAKRDGYSILDDTSGYAQASGTREELEAEMFSQYHWATDPPKYVKEWGETLHRELGVDPTPFKEVK